MARSSLLTSSWRRNLLRWATQIDGAFGTTSGHDHDGTNSKSVTASVTLDQAYDSGGVGVGRAITVNDGAITMTKNDAGTENVLEISCSPSAGAAGAALALASGANATGATLTITNAGSGNDVTGTAGWNVTKAGVGTFDSLAVGVMKLAEDVLGTGACMIGRDNTGDTTINALTGKQVHLAVNDVDVVNVSNTTLAVVGALTTTTSVTVGNTFTVTLGGAAITGNSTVTGNLAITGDLSVGGAYTFAAQITASAGIDMNGTELVMDTDGNSSLTMDTNDQLDIKLGGTDRVSFTTTMVDFGGLKLDLDAAGTTSITADTNNQIDIEINGADDFQLTANTFSVLSGSALNIDSGATFNATGNAIIVDDTLFGIGTGLTTRFSYDTTDGNANLLMLQLPAGGATDVPVLALGQSIESVDFGATGVVFNGVVDPTIGLFSSGAVATAGQLRFYKARGTTASPTVVTSADDLGSLDFFGAVAANEYVQAARIYVEMAGTIATTRGPGVIYFQTATDAAPSVLTTAMTISAAQLVTVAVGLTATTGNITATLGNVVVTAGDLSFTAASDVLIAAATAAALEISDATTKFYAIDTRVTTVGVTTHTFDISDYTLASAAGAVATGVSLAAHTLTYSGTTQVTTQVDTVVIGSRTLTAAGAVTVDEANSMLLVAPTEGGTVTLTAASALRIVNAGGTPVNQYGIYIEDLTVGATTDVGIYIAGADTAAIYVAADPIHVADNVVMGFGTGTGVGAYDASISYNATDLVIDPAVIGTGVIAVGSGESGATAGTGTTIRAVDVATGGAGNVNGAHLTLSSGLGTGTGTRGTVIVKTSVVAAAGDNPQTVATLMTFGEAFATLQAGAVFQSDGAAEIGISVDNAALVVGTEGSLVIPYRSSTAASFDDTAGGDNNGCVGIQYDSDTGPTSTIEVRSNGAWVSVAVSGVEIQGLTMGGSRKRGEWWHDNQILEPGWVDETVCLVCGEKMEVGDSVGLYANYERRDAEGHRNLHAIYGHMHLERDSYIQKLEARIAELEAKV